MQIWVSDFTLQNGLFFGSPSSRFCLRIFWVGLLIQSLISVVYLTFNINLHFLLFKLRPKDPMRLFAEAYTDVVPSQIVVKKFNLNR